MRQIIAIAGMVALAACGGAAEETEEAPEASASATATPSPSPKPTATETPEPEPAKGVELTSKGLVAGDEAFNFEAGRSEVEAALKELIGDPVNSGSNEECGAGPMDFVNFPGGLATSYQDGKLVGWTVGAAGEGEAASQAKITVEGPVQFGTPQATVEEASGFEAFEDSTLGDEFAIGDLFGFFEGGEVSMLYAGTQCFFR